MSKRIWFFLISALLVVVISALASSYIFKLREEGPKTFEVPKTGRVWNIKSVDTMKDSRDKARDKMNDYSYDLEIQRQTKLISSIGANYVAVGTPYDAEFVPYLRRWVTHARENGLNVWFRGNFSAWEGWFGYERNMTREEHVKKMREFIQTNPDLFLDGDIFTSCPECENGGPGDPRYMTSIEDYRNFMIQEKLAADEEFRKIGKSVLTNFNSMNLDVASKVYDRQTLDAMGNLIVVDHYSKEANTLFSEIDSLGKSTGAQIFLGEIGAPVVQFTGAMSEEEQAKWIDQALLKFSASERYIGANWWVGFNYESALFNEYGRRQGANIIEKYFKTHDLSTL